jgi:glycosyltransferase involved in cell wall biosynthesis
MTESSRPRIIVGTPAYNEEKYIGSIVLQCGRHCDEVVVIYDGSTDRTAMVAELGGATVVKHTENMGYGAAIQSILAEAKRRDADVLVILDADSQHNPDEIPTLIDSLSQGADIVIGSRAMHPNSVPRLRRLGHRVLSYFTNILSRGGIRDTESGFRAYSKKAIQGLKLREQGMAISAEIVSVATARGLNVVEVPISVSYSKDSSTLNPFRHGLGVLNRIMFMISERRPLLFFGTAGGISIGLGIWAGVIVVQTLQASQVLLVGTALISMLLITVGLLTLFTGLVLNVVSKRLSDSLARFGQKERGN